MNRLARRAGALALLALAAHAGAEPTPTPPVDLEGLEQGWYARIETSEGQILVRLHPEQTPQAVAHFAGLANATLPWLDRVTGETRATHYYDRAEVHRVVAGDRFEVGEPVGTVAPPPPIWVPKEFPRPIKFDQPYRLGFTAEAHNKISGVVWFISVAPLPHLNQQHPCMGTVVRGKDVARRLTEVRAYSNGRPIDPVTIYLVRVFPVGDPPPLEEPHKHDPRPDRLRMRDG